MNILGPDISVGEKLVRPAVAYGFVLIGLRRCSKRQVGRRGGACAARRPGPRDLRAVRRHHRMGSIRDIRYAFLEGDGHVSVVAGRPHRE